MLSRTVHLQIGYVALILVLASPLMLASCSQQRHAVFRSTSPDGSAEIQLATFLRFPARPGEVAELQLSSNRGKQIIKTWETPFYEMNPCLVVGAWSPNSERVVVLFRNCFHGSDLVAFDVKSSKTIDVSEMKSVLAAQIRSHYALADSISDPITWAIESEEARLAFKPASQP